MQEFDKYVYLHKDKEGVVRYVGHGNKDRPFEFSKSKRSKKWNNLFSEVRPDVEIVAQDLSYLEAIELENSLIKKYRDTIVNVDLAVPPPEMDYDWFDTWFYVDETSPTGLRWKAQRHRSRKYAGDIAGSLLTKDGGKQYWQIKLDYKVYKVHRVVYLLCYGDIDSSLVIDHIDGNGLNNRIENLRLVPQFVNGMNKSKSRNKTLPKNIKETKKYFYGSFEFKTRAYNFKARKDDFNSREDALQHIVNEVESYREFLYRESISGN